MKKNKVSVKINIICFIVLLTLQCIAMKYFAEQKVGFHVDEIYTFTLANYPDGFVSDQVVNSWHDGQKLGGALAVSSENRFNYDMVYKNQENDVHPPLYYYVIHTISSLFPGQFSQWMGIIPNMIFCIMVSIFLFLSVWQLCKNSPLALLVTAAWAFSMGVMNMSIFIRMYAMLTMFAVILFWCHLKAFEELAVNTRIKNSTIFMLFFCTLSGILIQYYYLIFCFFLCGIFAISLLCTQKWKELLKYVIAEFGAVGTAVIYYPAMLEHMFSGYRGKEALENLSAAKDYVGILRNVFGVLTKDLFNGNSFFILIVIIFIACSIYLFCQAKPSCTFNAEEHFLEIRINKEQRTSSNEKYFRLSSETLVVSLLSIVVLGYILVIARIAPYQTDRYYMCIYPFLSFIVIWALYKALLLAFRRQAVSIVLSASCILFITALSYKEERPSYSYFWLAQRAVLEEYAGYPAIVLNGAGYDAAPNSSLTEYANYSAVYWGAKDSNFSCLADAAESYDVSKGFLLYTIQMDMTDEKLFSQVRSYIPVASYIRLTEFGDNVYFCTLEVEP